MTTVPIKHRLILQLRMLSIFCLRELLAAKHRVKAALYTDKMVVTRCLIGLSSLTWGAILIGPEVLFTDKRTTYLVMRAMLAEQTWAYLFLISGAVSLWAVVFDVRNRVTLVFDAILGALLWTSSTLACFAAHWPQHIPGGWFAQWHAYPPPAAMSGEFWLSMAAWWHLIRHATDHRPADYSDKNYRYLA